MSNPTHDDTTKSTVFIGNLTWAASESDVSEFVEFQDKIVSVKIQRYSDTNRSKGWCLVKFVDNASAVAAVQKLDGKDFNGRRVFARLDKPPDQLPQEGISVFVGNIPWQATAQDMNELFADFHPIECSIATNMSGKSRGFALVLFETKEIANAAIEVVNQTEFRGRTLECRIDVSVNERPFRDKESLRIYVGNLGPNMGESDLESMFSRAGAVVSVLIRQTDSSSSSSPRRWGVVKFSTEAAAKKAVRLFNGVIATGCDEALTVRVDRKF